MQGLRRGETKVSVVCYLGPLLMIKLGTDKGNLTLLKCVTINTKRVRENVQSIYSCVDTGNIQPQVLAWDIIWDA
jgi:hypothetical protein